METRRSPYFIFYTMWWEDDVTGRPYEYVEPHRVPGTARDTITEARKRHRLACEFGWVRKSFTKCTVSALEYHDELGNVITVDGSGSLDQVEANCNA